MTPSSQSRGRKIPTSAGDGPVATVAPEGDHLFQSVARLIPRPIRGLTVAAPMKDGRSFLGSAT